MSQDSMEVAKKFKDFFMTLKEIEEKYGVKKSTVKAYLTRGEVIPNDKKIKIGNQWFTEREFAENKWGKKGGNKNEKRF